MVRFRKRSLNKVLRCLFVTLSVGFAAMIANGCGDRSSIVEGTLSDEARQGLIRKKVDVQPRSKKAIAKANGKAGSRLKSAGSTSDSR